MAIKNGVERIEKLRTAMHDEIDKLIDETVLKKPTTGFKISFECGVDRLLVMSLNTDLMVKDDEGHFVTLEGKGDAE